MIARAGLIPTDERARQIYRNPTALAFIDHWQQRVKDDDFNRLGDMLGVRWTRNMVEQLFAENRAKQASSAPLEEVHYPLAAILEPGLQEQLKKMFGHRFGYAAPDWARDQESYEDMFTMKREEFQKFVGAFVSPVAPRDPYVSKAHWQPQHRRKVQRRTVPQGLPEWAGGSAR